ncbi:unnamed protein product [Schistocephalus solidus]|uniref:Uncharacterized protein n=1 Tax=Schistocephalus solidus TaxID=70667 RepID=A0A3P7D2E0_SCHSO|nr:unnamed protein product [Schistocephalus solidus]
MKEVGPVAPSGVAILGRATRRWCRLAVRNDTMGSLPCLPQGINNHLMSLRLPLRGDKFPPSPSPVPTPPPPRTTSDEGKNKFYDDLHALLVTAPKVDKLIVIDDLNVHAGTDHATVRVVPGPHVLDGVHENGFFLLRTWTEPHLILTNTFFGLPRWQKVTWIYSLKSAGLCLCLERIRAGHTGDKGDHQCRPMDGSSPRHLEPRIRFQARQNSRRQRGRLCGNLWWQLRDTVQSTALDLLGRARHQHQDRFNKKDAAINNLMAEKKRLYKTYVDRPTDATILPHFTGNLSLSIEIDDAVAQWMAKASKAFGYMHNIVWIRHGLNLSTNLKMYKAFILSKQLYEAETWKKNKNPQRSPLEQISQLPPSHGPHPDTHHLIPPPQQPPPLAPMRTRS